MQKAVLNNVKTDTIRGESAWRAGPCFGSPPTYTHTPLLFLLSSDSHHILGGFYLAGVLHTWLQDVSENAPGNTGPLTGPTLPQWGAPSNTLGNLAAFPLEELSHFPPLISFLKHTCKTPELLNLSTGNLPQIPGEESVK